MVTWITLFVFSFRQSVDACFYFSFFFSLFFPATARLLPFNSLSIFLLSTFTFNYFHFQLFPLCKVSVYCVTFHEICFSFFISPARSAPSLADTPWCLYNPLLHVPKMSPFVILFPRSLHKPHYLIQKPLPPLAFENNPSLLSWFSPYEISFHPVISSNALLTSHLTYYEYRTRVHLFVLSFFPFSAFKDYV